MDHDSADAATHPTNPVDPSLQSSTTSPSLVLVPPPTTVPVTASVEPSVKLPDTAQVSSVPLPSTMQTPKRPPEEVAREVLESRSAKLFRPSQQRFDPRRVQLSPDFFEPTAGEVSSALRSLTADVHRLTDAPLMTRKMRDDRAKKRMSRFRKVVIRILLPDRVALQGIFEPTSTIRQVQRFVRAALRDARSVRFHLFVVPPKMKLLDLDVTLWSQGLVPAALVHLGIDDGTMESGGLLKDFLLQKMEDAPESIAAAEVAMAVPRPVTENSETVAGAGARADGAKKGLAKKVPKWFKK